MERSGTGRSAAAYAAATAALFFFFVLLPVVLQYRQFVFLVVVGRFAAFYFNGVFFAQFAHFETFRWLVGWRADDNTEHRGSGRTGLLPEICFQAAFRTGGLFAIGIVAAFTP